MLRLEKYWKRLMSKPAIIIVDGVSQSAKLARNFSAYGIACIHIQTLQCAHDYYMQSICVDDYIHTIQFDGNVDKLLTQLQGYAIQCAIAGFDTGVELADRINAHFHLPGNDVGSSLLRRNKYLQNQLLKNKDCVEIKHASELAAIKKYPVIVKPLQSASCDSVFYCRNQEEAQIAFSRIIAKQNDLGEKNHTALVETFLQGREFKVNTVSYEHKHVISDAWDMTKKLSTDGEILYRHAFLLSEKELQELRNFVFSMLNQFRVAYGAATLDIMLTDHGPVLIELGARLMGQVAPDECVKQSLGNAQLDCLLAAYSDQEKFLQYCQQSYSLKKKLYVHYVHQKKAGIVDTVCFLGEIQQLASVFQVACSIKPGDTVIATKDYSSIPMMIILQHAEQSQIDDDLKVIQQYEVQGFVKFK